MFARSLTAGLMIGAGLLAGATARADDTIVLKRVKADAPAQQLQRAVGDEETQDVRYRRGGFVGYRGFGYGYRGFGYGYYPRVRVGVYVSPYYVAPPAYYYPSYYYTSRTIYIAPSYYPIANLNAGSAPVFQLKTDRPAVSPPGIEDLPPPRPAGGNEDLPPPRPAGGNENLPPPRRVVPPQTFPYDGSPQVPVPMPRPDPASKGQPPADTPDDGKVVSLPPKDKFAYPAYGDKPVRSADGRTVVIKDDAKKPNK
jgi:hypothetical protein